MQKIYKISTTQKNIQLSGPTRTKLHAVITGQFEIVYIGGTSNSTRAATLMPSHK